ncbi:hypothetical protein BA062_30235 [Prauserella flavalba]|uniref:Mycothiol-dependent maleylpyruvate isomerase metal-binding domain-containing protein n=2 Tax=Prauserella flavalba TaxID=1477506 RepID=A0A318LL46_9PSEU|nr:hypothetical protein BA062_30235 [Prauserella flavalba]
MIPEAEVFLLADQAAMHVLTRIPGERLDTLLPPVFDMPGADRPTPLREVVAHLAYDEAWIPDLLAGRSMDEVGKDAYDGDLLGDDPAGNLTRLGEAARAAARTVTDREAPVHCSYGVCATWDYFWQLNVARTLTAHDVAAHLGLGSPLSEELSRRMYDGSVPLAPRWREIGVFREPVPVAGDASWRTRYLALTGRRA